MTPNHYRSFRYAFWPMWRGQLSLCMAGIGAVLVLKSAWTGAPIRRPDLLLLDMQLPDMDGLDVLRQLRQEPGLADLPVLVVSANALPEQQAAAQALGVQAYLTKPLDLQTLLAQLDALFDDGTAR